MVLLFHLQNAFILAIFCRVKLMYFPDLLKKLSLFMPGHYQSLISSCASERVLS